MGMGIVELSTSPGPTRSFVANMDCRMGDVLVALVDEDLFPCQNRHLTVILESQLRRVINEG